MPTTRTKRELIVRALQRLQVLEPGQSLAPENETTLGDVVDNTLADLSAREIYYVADSDEIPIEAFEALSAIVADMAKSDFGKAGDAGLVAEAVAAEGRLYRMTETQPTGARQITEYY